MWSISFFPKKTTIYTTFNDLLRDDMDSTCRPARPFPEITKRVWGPSSLLTDKLDEYKLLGIEILVNLHAHMWSDGGKTKQNIKKS